MSDTAKPIYNPHPYSMLVEARIMFEAGMGIVEDAMRDMGGGGQMNNPKNQDEVIIVSDEMLAMARRAGVAKFAEDIEQERKAEDGR